MPIDNYEQYKRVIKHRETIHAYIYIKTKKLFDLEKIKLVCVVIYENLLVIHL